MAAWMEAQDATSRVKMASLWAVDRVQWETLLLLGGLVADPAGVVHEVMGDGQDPQRLLLAAALLHSTSRRNGALEQETAGILTTSLQQGVTQAHQEAAAVLAAAVAGEL